MKMHKIKTALIVANNVENELNRACSTLLAECQTCCEVPLSFCEYQSADGFCLGYDNGIIDNQLISVTSFIELVSKSKRRLTLEDLQGVF